MVLKNQGFSRVMTRHAQNFEKNLASRVRWGQEMFEFLRVGAGVFNYHASR